MQKSQMQAGRYKKSPARCLKLLLAFLVAMVLLDGARLIPQCQGQTTAGSSVERADGSAGRGLWTDEQGVGVEAAQNKKLVEVRDREILDKAGHVEGLKDRKDAKNLSQIAESAFPHSAKMLAAYEMLQDEIANLSGGAETEEHNKDKASKREPIGPLIAQHQSVITQLRAVENLLDPSTIQFENSVGIMNKQQFFSEHEQRLISRTYQIEDILHHRLVHLANLTSAVVFDDAERMLLNEGRTGLTPSEIAVSTSELNPRKNPQFDQLQQFYQLARGVLLEQMDSSQDEGAEELDEAEIVVDDQVPNKKNVAAMGPFFLQTALRPTLLKELKHALDFSVTPIVFKNTTFYVDASAHQKASGKKKVRVSYRYYRSSRPELHADRHPQAPYEDEVLMAHDEHSIHHQVLRSFEELHVKALDEREQSPPVLLQRDAQASGNADESKRSRQYQEKYYGRKTCEVQAPVQQQSETCKKSTKGSHPQFSPPFGSFMREMYEGPNPSVYDYPVEEIEQAESQRILRKIMSMKALHLHNQNFEILKAIYGSQAVSSASKFRELLFTYEEPDHVKALTQGTVPQRIQDLPKTSGHASFFEQEVEIKPKRVNVKDPISLLTPYMEIITIKNKNGNQRKPIVIHDVFPSSPDIDARLENGKTFPLILQPGESTRIRLIATPGSYGRFDALVYILLQERVLITSFRAHVYPNRFGLEPIYLPHVPQLTSVNVGLTVGNPYPMAIDIEDIHLTNQKFVPTNVKDSIEAISNKTICNITYQQAQPGPALESTSVSIRFSTGDYVRVPIYVRVVNNFVETKPVILDFGLVQLNQQPLKMDLWIRVNEKNVQRIVDFLLPVDEENIHFKMFDPIQLGHPTLQNCEASERQRRQRKPCLDDDGFATYLAGHVVLDPVRAKFISTSIQMEVELREQKNQKELVWLEEKWVSKDEVVEQIPSRNNHTILVEIPILASVVNHTELFSAYLSPEQQSNISGPLPLYALDLTSNFSNSSNDSSLVLYPDLLVKNNLGQPITVQNIKVKSKVNHTDRRPSQKHFFDLKHHDARSQLLIKLGKFTQAPGDVISYGEQVIRMGRLPYRSGQHLVWLRINHVMVPAQIQIFNRQLLCEWRSDQIRSKNISNGGVTLCSNLAGLEYGVVGTGQERSRILKVWNPNSVAISLDQAIKSQLDDVSIELLEVVDRRGRAVQPIWRPDSLIPQQHKEGPIEIMSSKRTKKYIGLIMQPFESIVLRFKVSSTVARRRSSKLQVVCGPHGVKSIEIAHTYQVLEGVLSVQPAALAFAPGLAGTPQSKILATRSTFSVPTRVISVRSLDPRIEAKILDPTIQPWNVSTSVMVTFDAGLAGPNKEQSEFVKKMARFGLEGAELPKTFKGWGDKRGRPEMRGARGADGNQAGVAASNELLLNPPHSLNESLSGHKSPHLALHHGLLHHLSGQRLREQRIFSGSGSKDQDHEDKSDSGTSTPESSSRDFDVSLPLQYDDLTLWQDHRDNWASLEKRGQTHINTSLIIQTDIVESFEVPITAKLRKPQILASPRLDFGTVQIGDSVFQDVEIMNPTAEPLQVQLFIGYDLDWQKKLYSGPDEVSSNKSDLAAHADRLLRQMNLYVQGVETNLINDVDGMFETFRRGDMGENDSTVQLSSDSVDKEPLKFYKIIDILLSLQPTNSTKSAQKDAALGADKNQKQGTKGSSSQSQPLAGIDLILHYWRQIEDDVKEDYASLYCLQVFLDKARLLERNSFMEYIEEELESPKWHLEQPLSLVHGKDPVGLCVQSLHYLHKLRNGFFDTTGGEEQQKEKAGQASESGKEAVEDWLTVQGIQNHYKTLYEHVYDLDWLVERSLQQQCHETSPLDHLSNLTSVDNFPQVVKAIESYERLLLWKQTMQEYFKSYKRQKIDIDRLDPSQVDSLAVVEGARLQLQERYIFYQTQRSPIINHTDQRLLLEDRRLSEELLKLEIYHDLLLYWYEKKQPNNRNSDFDRLTNWGKNARDKLKQNWPERLAIEKLCADHITAVFEEFQQEGDASGLVKRGFYLDTLAGLGRAVQELLIGIMDTLGYVFAADLYEYARLALTENQGDLNPLGGLSDRYQLQNTELQRKMIHNQLVQLAAAQPILDHDSQIFTPELSRQQLKQNFFLNPIYKNQVFTVAPKSNFTMKNAIVFQPQSIERKHNHTQEGPESTSAAKQFTDYLKMSNIAAALKSSQMQLFVKNNLTYVESMGLTGHGTTALLELVDIQKDFINVLDEVDQSGKPIIFADRISVGDSSKYNLHVQTNYMCNFEDSLASEQTGANITIALEELERRNGRKKAQIKENAGTDDHVLASLFDAQTREEFEAVEIAPRYEDQEGNRVQQTTVERLVSRALSKKTYRQKANRDAVELQEQSYWNYIVFNIPLSDIFRRIPNNRQSGQMIGARRGGEASQGQEMNEKSEEIQSPLFYIDEFHDPDIDEETYCHGNSSSFSQRRMRGLVDKPSLRQRVATILGRWDTQDHRPDLNWTELSLQAQRGKVDIVYQHTRHIILQNTGAVGMRIEHFKLDDLQDPCSSASGKLYIKNCEYILNWIIKPREKIAIELVYTEDYKYSKFRKTLTVETDQFSQKFLIDFIVPQRAQILVQKAETQLKSSSDRGIFSLIALFGNIVFMLILLYLTMLIAAAMKKDFEDQGILTKDSLVGIEGNGSKGTIISNLVASEHVSLISKGKASQQWIRGIQLTGNNNNAKESAPGLPDKQSLETSSQQLTPTTASATNDFLDFCSSSFVSETLPSSAHSRHASSSSSTIGKVKSPVFGHFQQTNSALASDPAKFSLDALRYCQMKDLATMEAQDLAKRALLGKKNWKRPGKGLSHETSSQLMRAKNAIQVAVAGLGNRLDMLEKEELKKQIDAVSMKVSQQYSVLNTVDVDQRRRPDAQGSRSGESIEQLKVQIPREFRRMAGFDDDVAQNWNETARQQRSVQPSDQVPSRSIRGVAAASDEKAKQAASKADAKSADQKITAPASSSRPGQSKPQKPHQDAQATQKQKPRQQEELRAPSGATTTTLSSTVMSNQPAPAARISEGNLEEEVEEAKAVRREELHNTEHGQTAPPSSGAAGAPTTATGEASKDKRLKVKKYNKKEMKKKEARLKREQELAENSKRMEILQQERDRRREMVEAEMIRRRQREKEEADREQGDSEDWGRRGGETDGEDATYKGDEKLDDEGQKIDRSEEGEVKSSRYSEEEGRRRNESPASTSEASLRTHTGQHKDWNGSDMENFVNKNPNKLYNSLDSAQKSYPQNYKQQAQLSQSSKPQQRYARYQNPNRPAPAGHSPLNQPSPPPSVDHRHHASLLSGQESSSRRPAQHLAQHPAPPDDFWKNYEKQLGVLKEEVDADEHGETDQGAAWDREDGADGQGVRAEGSEEEKEEADAVHSEQEALSVGDRDSEGGERRDDAGGERDDIEEREEDDDLPLFQQKRYLQLQEQNVQKGAGGKGKVGQGKQEEQIVSGQAQSTRAVGATGSAAVRTGQSSKGARTHPQVEEAGQGGRRTYEKSSHDDTKSDGCADATSRDNAQRRALLRSRNPYADINNPNNPNYKGRPGNKDIESYLAQRNILRERELRKRSAVGDSSDDQESEEGNSYDDERDYDGHYKPYRGEQQRLDAGDSFEDSEEAYYSAGQRFTRPSSKYAMASKYQSGKYDHLADYGNAHASYRTAAVGGGGRGRARGQIDSVPYEEHYLHRAPSSRGGRGRGRGRGAATAVSQHKYDDYVGREKRSQQIRYHSTRYDVAVPDYYRDGNDSADDYHSKQYDRRSKHDWHDLRDRDRESAKNSKNERAYHKYGRDASREGTSHPDRERSYYGTEEYAQTHGKSGIYGIVYQGGRLPIKEKRTHPSGYFGKDKEDFVAEKGQARLQDGHHGRDSKIDEGKYDHDQVMLMRRARGRALQTSDTFQRGTGRGERGGTRGERAGNPARGGRGGASSTSTHQYLGSRTKGQYGTTTESYKFKVKDKEMRDEAAQRKRSNKEMKDESKEEDDGGDKPQPEDAPSRSYSSSGSNVSNSGSERSDAEVQNENSDQKSTPLTEDEAEKQIEEEPVAGAEVHDDFGAKHSQQCAHSESMEQRSDSKNDEKEGTAEAGASKSVYETFMDVSSIFSNPILSFKGTGRTRSRFFDEVEEEDEQDDPIDSLLRNPGQVFNESMQDGAQDSIFSSSSHFLGDTQQRTVNPITQTNQSIFSVFGHGLWSGNASNAASDHDNVNLGGDMMQQQQHSRPQYSSPLMFGSALGTGQGGQQYQHSSSTSGTGTAGLSSTSFANLRKRALDAGRNEANQIRPATIVPEAEQTPQVAPHLFEEPEHHQQSLAGSQSRKFMALGALPVPKFLQESKARENQYQRLLDEEEDGDGGQDAILKDLIQ